MIGGVIKAMQGSQRGLQHALDSVGDEELSQLSSSSLLDLTALPKRDEQQQDDASKKG